MTTVLVTGAGGAAGVAVIRELAGPSGRVVAVDADPLAAGLFLADAHAVVPRCTDRNFAAALADVAARFEVDAVICTVAEEMVALMSAGERVGPAAVWLPTEEAVDACVDKWQFARRTAAHGIPVPATALGLDDCVPGPWIVKPRFGRGSRDVYAVDDAGDLAWACRRISQPVVQTRVSGREFTVDLLTDRAGEVAGAVPRWRLETKAGISTKGQTFDDERVVEISARTLSALGLRGAANLQGFVTEADEVLVIEVNPRFSGALPLSIAAGADLVGEFLRGTLGQPVRPERLRFRPGVTMTRHLTEVFATAASIESPHEVLV